jgi:hypothetical protein
VDESAFVEVTVQLAMFIHSFNSNLVITEEHWELISAHETTIREDIFHELDNLLKKKNMNFHLTNYNIL